ncbi:hypothetical protein E5676_scaffold692G00590 [Cucumis melo var. makuwa]|uniref:Uncharacterized protein n=1 Tax=Cucumis melo var. makuwa TaxID=1194695 RepID=A0A5D3CS24_CUCMM|nr:hypothetical protein E6C27_scaffold749G00580 [Cucumis melo var. makuwa]TYK14727.1 hypothetical protein E5676_scaffold692G00590 [Cucumis melo var. makuwa]
MQGGRIEKVRRCVVPGVKSWARHWSLNLAALSFVVKDGILPTHKNVGKSEKNVGKGYADVFHGVRNNVVRNELEEAFSTPYQQGVEHASPKVVTCVGQRGVGSSSPDRPYADA